jgi:hypothetical protein
MLKNKKDNIIENMGENTYKKICDGTFDINKIYKNIIPYE